MNERIYRKELGDGVYFDRTRRHIWFTWEGLTRYALHCEFGAAYEDLARKRDRVGI